MANLSEMEETAVELDAGRGEEGRERLARAMAGIAGAQDALAHAEMAEKRDRPLAPA